MVGNMSANWTRNKYNIYAQMWDIVPFYGYENWNEYPFAIPPKIKSTQHIIHIEM